VEARAGIGGQALLKKAGSTDEQPEVRWMERISNGDAEAFRSLVERHQRQVLNLAYRYCGDRQISEDLTQEIFLKVYLNAARWRPEREFHAWIHRIAVNHCLNFKRGKQHREIRVQDPGEKLLSKSFMPAAGASVKGDLSPETALSRKQEASRAREALSGLSPRQRMAVILQRFHDLSYREIAFRMGCSEKAVESLLVRAYGNMKKRFQG